MLAVKGLDLLCSLNVFSFIPRLTLQFLTEGVKTTDELMEAIKVSNIDS